MEQQTAVEWLISQILEDQIIKAKSVGEWKIIYQQAKEMQKKQHGKTWDAALDLWDAAKFDPNANGAYYYYSEVWEDFDEYYSEAFEPEVMATKKMANNELLLSPTHIRILELIIEGHSREEIGKRLKIKKYTVESYLRDMNKNNDCKLNQLIWRYAHLGTKYQLQSPSVH